MTTRARALAKLLSTGTVLSDSTVSASKVSGLHTVALTGSYADLMNKPTTLSAFTNDSGYATTSYVNTQVSNLVASAPAALDTLNELASALGNNANFSTTITTALANRLRVDTSTQNLTSTEKTNAKTNLDLQNVENKSSATIRGELTSGNVTTALGFTPYNATNPSGYITGNQTITFSGDATGSGTTAVALTLANSGATAGTYGSSSAIPVLTVDAKGRVTGISTTAVNIPSGALTFTGDVTGTGSTGSSTALTLANSGVTAGTYTKVTVDAKGRVTTGTTLASADLPTYTGTLTSSQVTTALGFTPYNSTNPNGYITSSGSISGNAATATALQTARSINATSFNGTADITIPRVRAIDDRTAAPADGTTAYATFGFGSWNNNNTDPYADFWLMRSYTDSSGGSDNMVMFRKNGLGMRVWQQTYGSSTAFSTFKDVAWTDGTNASGTWGIRITGFANQGSQRLYSTDSAYSFDSANPYFGSLTYDGSRWLFQVSPGTPAAVRVAYADSAGSVSNGLTTSNFSSYALPLSGGTLSGSVTISPSATLSFGSGTRQMINLWSTSYGIGVQSSTTYFRSDARFSWHRGGSHSDSENNPGGGTVAMTLDSSSNLTATGNVTAYSDERLKKDWADLPHCFIEQLAEVKSGTYTRTDADMRQVGVSAQSLQKLMPEAVLEGEYLSVSYGNAALAACVELAKELVKLKQELLELKAQKNV